MNTQEWLEFSEHFKQEMIPEAIGRELLDLVNHDFILAKVIYGIFNKGSLNWISNWKHKILEDKTPLTCIKEGRFDLLYPALMAATQNNEERGKLKANLLKLFNNKYINTSIQTAAILYDQGIPAKRRALIALILKEISDENTIASQS